MHLIIILGILSTPGISRKISFHCFAQCGRKWRKSSVQFAKNLLVKLVNHRVNQFREIYFFSFWIFISFDEFLNCTFIKFSGPLWLDFHSIYHSTKKIYIHTQIKIITVALGSIIILVCTYFWEYYIGVLLKKMFFKQSMYVLYM